MGEGVVGFPDLVHSLHHRSLGEEGDMIGAVGGEYLGSSEGMGWVISYAEAQFNSTQVIAGLIVLMAVVALMDFGLKRLEDHLSHWKPSGGGPAKEGTCRR